MSLSSIESLDNCSKSFENIINIVDEFCDQRQREHQNQLATRNKNKLKLKNVLDSYVNEITSLNNQQLVRPNIRISSSHIASSQNYIQLALLQKIEQKRYQKQHQVNTLNKSCYCSKCGQQTQFYKVVTNLMGRCLSKQLAEEKSASCQNNSHSNQDTIRIQLTQNGNLESNNKKPENQQKTVNMLYQRQFKKLTYVMRMQNNTNVQTQDEVLLKQGQHLPVDEQTGNSEMKKQRLLEQNSELTKVQAKMRNIQELTKQYLPKISLDIINNKQQRKSSTSNVQDNQSRQSISSLEQLRETYLLNKARGMDGISQNTAHHHSSITQPNTNIQIQDIQRQIKNDLEQKIQCQLQQIDKRLTKSQKQMRRVIKQDQQFLNEKIVENKQKIDYIDFYKSAKNLYKNHVGQFKGLLQQADFPQQIYNISQAYFPLQYSTSSSSKRQQHINQLLLNTYFSSSTAKHNQQTQLAFQFQQAKHQLTSEGQQKSQPRTKTTQTQDQRIKSNQKGFRIKKDKKLGN